LSKPVLIVSGEATGSLMAGYLAQAGCTIRPPALRTPGRLTAAPIFEATT